MQNDKRPFNEWPFIMSEHHETTSRNEPFILVQTPSISSPLSNYKPIQSHHHRTSPSKGTALATPAAVVLPTSYRALITGGTGFVGSHIARLLHQQGHTVRILHRANSKMDALQGIPFESALGDVTDIEAVKKAVEG